MDKKGNQKPKKKKKKEMALSTTNTFFLSSNLQTSTSSTQLSVCPTLKTNLRRDQLTLSKALSELALSKRNLSLCLISSFVFSLGGNSSSIANAAILEADDDVELLEKVKRDRKKRLERQGVLNSSRKETGYLQEVVYNLSKVGQAIDNNDLSAAVSVLGRGTDTDWVQKANLAFGKLSSDDEEKTQVETFNSSLTSLISSVTSKDVESSKVAFVSSATAFEKWTTMTGLVSQLKGI